MRLCLIILSIFLFASGCQGVYYSFRGYRPGDPPCIALWCGLSPFFLFIALLGLMYSVGCFHDN